MGEGQDELNGQMSLGVSEEPAEDAEEEAEASEPDLSQEKIPFKKKDLMIQQRIYDMILYAYPALEQMPKSQKFSLAQDMKHCMDRIMRLTITANKKYTKKTTLQELDVEIASLKVYLRIAYDLKYLPPKKYEVWSGQIVEIGKMVGGWIKSQREATRPPSPGTEKRVCLECGAEIPEKAYDYSVRHFGRPLCYKCQRKNR